MQTVEIIICMGSSCYSRGNGKNYTAIKEYLNENGVDSQVDIRGCRCGGHCMSGPNIWINGVHYQNVDRGSVIDIMKYSLSKTAAGEKNVLP